MGDDREGWESEEHVSFYETPWWEVGRAQIWTWVEVMLTSAPIPQIGASVVRGFCELALETYAPAVVVNAQAAGVDPGRLLFAAVAERYRDRFGRPHRRKSEVARLRLVIQMLRLRSDRLVQNQGRLFEVTRAVAHSTDRSRPVVCHATAVAGSLGFKQTPRKQH